MQPGEAKAPENDDTFLRLRPSLATSTLADVLVPEESAGVSTDHVTALLRGISMVDAGVHIGLDGGFALGPLAGAHQPARARYIGATARAHHRALRIEALGRERSAEALARDTARADEQRLDAAVAELKQARQSLPSYADVRQHRSGAQTTLAVATSKAAAKAQAQSGRDAQQRKRDTANRAFRAVAAQHGLAADAKALRALAQHIDDAQRALRTYADSLARCLERREASTQARERHQSALHERDAQAVATQQAQTAFDAEQQRYATLQAGLGTELKQIQSQLATATQARRQAQAEAEAANHAREVSVVACATSVTKSELFSEQLPERQRDLADAMARLAPFQATAIAQTLGVSADEAPFSQRLAAVVQHVSSTPEQLKATETRLHSSLDRLDEALGARYHHSHRYEDGVIVVRIADETGESDVASFQRRIAERLERVRDLLQESEKKVFEAHLLKSLIGRLRDRIAETRALCSQMDQAMRACRLASGKHLGIRWRALPDVDPTRRELLELLKFDPSLSTDKIGRMRELLSEEVQLERRDNPDRTYMEILVRALDYRVWHRFDLLLLDANGKEERLTAARHGKLSGGEKAATVHLPLFAAAHAHFKTARPDCPRLIALDEAFAGIDETGTPELLRLAAAFDLDWFLTGHNLWVTEPFLPAVMHYDLAHDEATRAVSAWPILWNGHETVDGGLA